VEDLGQEVACALAALGQKAACALVRTRARRCARRARGAPRGLDRLASVPRGSLRLRRPCGRLRGCTARWGALLSGAAAFSVSRLESRATCPASASLARAPCLGQKCWRPGAGIQCGVTRGWAVRAGCNGPGCGQRAVGACQRCSNPCSFTTNSARHKQGSQGRRRHLRRRHASTVQKPASVLHASAPQAARARSRASGAAAARTLGGRVREVRAQHQLHAEHAALEWRPRCALRSRVRSRARRGRPGCAAKRGPARTENRRRTWAVIVRLHVHNVVLVDNHLHARASRPALRYKIRH